MAEPIGSYLASAAEAERNRRQQTGMQDKSLSMQKYGIDTSAQTSRYGIDTTAKTASNLLDFNKEKWGTEDARRSTLFNQAQDIYGAQKEITSGLIDTYSESERAGSLYDDLQTDDSKYWFPNLREGDIEADEYKTFGGKVKKWWRDEGFYSGWGDKDSAYDSKYNLKVGDQHLNPQEVKLNMEKLKSMPPEMIRQYLNEIESIDVSGGSMSTGGLMNIFNPYVVQ